VNIADLGQAPQDGFTEYLGYPGPTQPRWGDYSNAVFMGGRYYFATKYIQYRTACRPSSPFRSAPAAGPGTAWRTGAPPLTTSCHKKGRVTVKAS
jgi:hypothetical protein